MSQGEESIDPDEGHTLLYLVATVSIAISIALAWYRDLSTGWISLGWILITIMYVLFVMLLGIPTELAAVVGTIPAGMAIFSMRKHHKENIF